MRNKTGFTLAETVIALAIIILVSAATVTVILSSMSARRAATQKAHATHFANDAWECFKASDSSEEYIRALDFATGTLPVTGTDDTQGYTTLVFVSEEHRYTATIRYNYAADRTKPDDTAQRSVLSVTVTNEGGTELLSLQFTKGDGT